MQNIETIKQPATDYNIHPLIASRWSPRAYNSKPVEKDKLSEFLKLPDGRLLQVIFNHGISL
jgi:hypothetical protein